MVVAERIDDAVPSASQNRGKNGLSSLKNIVNMEKSVCQNARPDTSRVKQFHDNKRNHNSADGSDTLTIAQQFFSKGNEPANASSPSDGPANPLPRRRKPKLRSLADIIMEERNPPTENRRPRSARQVDFRPPLLILHLHCETLKLHKELKLLNPNESLFLKKKQHLKASSIQVVP